MIANDRAFIAKCIEWDVVNWSKALRYWRIHSKIGEGNLECLELGGNHGGLSLWLASMNNRVICSDLTDPQNRASQLHSLYPTGDLISYQAIDATAIPYENKFDIVVFKSILGGISRNGRDDLKHQTIGQILKALKPGGTLLFAENLESSRLHQWVRRKFTKWGESWNYLNRSEIEPMFVGFESTEIAMAGFFGTFGRTEVQRNILGKIDTLIFDKILPRGLRYIVFGVARKKSH